jgi:hypothetical protein
MSTKKHCDYVFHVSPFSGLGKLRPTGGHKGTQSVTMSQGGVYVAPHFRDALAWYASFVRHKKNESNARRKHRSENGPNRGLPHECLYYHGATVYKLAIPKGFLKGLWSSGWWEPEYFIPGEMMDQVHIVSATTYDDGELLDLYARAEHKRWEAQRGRWDAEKLARSLRRNVAAKAWLQMLEEFRDYSMSRQVFDDVKGEQFQRGRSEIWRHRCTVFNSLMGRLSDLFRTSKFCEAPVGIDRCPDVPLMEKIVARIRQLIATPDDQFHYYAWMTMRDRVRI